MTALGVVGLGLLFVAAWSAACVLSLLLSFSISGEEVNYIPHRISVKLLLNDAWVGVYWRTRFENGSRMVSVFVCIIPFVPVRLDYGWEIQYP